MSRIGQLCSWRKNSSYLLEITAKGDILCNKLSVGFGQLYFSDYVNIMSG